MLLKSIIYKIIFINVLLSSLFFDAKGVITITNTSPKTIQYPTLLSLCITFKHVDNLTWIILEKVNTEAVETLIRNCNLKIVHLTFGENKFPYNVALDHIRKGNFTDHVIYFASENNIYDAKLFKNIKQTKKAMMFKCGLSNGFIYEGPVLDKNGTIKTYKMKNNLFSNTTNIQINLSGISLHSSMISQSTVQFGTNCTKSIEECFIRDLGISEWKHFETMPENKIMVWHAQKREFQPSTHIVLGKHPYLDFTDTFLINPKTTTKNEN